MNIKITALISLVLVAATVIGASRAVQSAGDDDADLSSLSRRPGFICEKPGAERYDRWGLSGRERVCEITLAESASIHDRGAHHDSGELADIACDPPGLTKIKQKNDGTYKVVCELSHGSFWAAENGRIAVTGQHHLGKSVGRWVWYGDDGEVARIIDYGMAEDGN